jgi:hypothetical protein
MSTQNFVDAVDALALTLKGRGVSVVSSMVQYKEGEKPLGIIVLGANEKGVKRNFPRGPAGIEIEYEYQ